MSNFDTIFTVGTGGWTVNVTLGDVSMCQHGVLFSERYEIAEILKDKIRSESKES